jgi:hypothetical protein
MAFAVAAVIIESLLLLHLHDFVLVVGHDLMALSAEKKKTILQLIAVSI